MLHTSFFHDKPKIWHGLLLPVLAKEHYFNRVGQISNVNQEVNDSHEGHHNQIIPRTAFTICWTGVLANAYSGQITTAVAYIATARMFEANDHFVKRNWKDGRQLGDGEGNNQQWKNEA